MYGGDRSRIRTPLPEGSGHSTIQFDGSGQAHLEGGKQDVRGDIIVPLSRDGVVMASCRDATIYIANVGPRCILGVPISARYGIHI